MGLCEGCPESHYLSCLSSYFQEKAGFKIFNNIFGDFPADLLKMCSNQLPFLPYIILIQVVFSMMLGYILFKVLS